MLDLPKIIMRNDDVLGHSSAYDNPVPRFKKYQRWMLEGLDDFEHMPTIVVTYLEKWPEAIDFIREETAEGRMRPELHGWDHIDYNSMPLGEIREDLDKSLIWMSKNLVVTPKFFYTPWGGAPSLAVQAACTEFGLTPLGVQNTVSCSGVLRYVKQHGHISASKVYAGREILTHWWQKNMRVPRLVKIWHYGGLAQAMKAEPELYE
jgi:peptidoglycan/xylan/chitin deacetylase (PgdA/CDA1 family)